MTRRAVLLLLAAIASTPDRLRGAKRPVTWQQVESESDLERKASLALDYASQQVPAIVEAFKAGQADTAEAAIAELVKSVEAAKEALDETGKVARKRPKHFKRAEIATRRLVESIDDAQRGLLAAERKLLEPAKERVEEINSQLMLAIFR